jgi:hypothetical protein
LKCSASLLMCLPLLLSACYPEPKPQSAKSGYFTTCGLELLSGNDEDLARLERQERITLQALSNVQTNVAWTPEVTCAQLQGTAVRIEPLPDGGMWNDDQFFELKRGFDRGRYEMPYEVRVTTYNWANPEFSWQLVRVITRGQGELDELLWLTGPSIAEATRLGREQVDVGVVPLTSEQ